MNKKIIIFGAGYVGFSLALVLSRIFKVTIIDTNPKVVACINAGKSPIAEQGIELHLKNSQTNNNLFASEYNQELLSKADFVVLALPTNFDSEKKEFNTEALDGVLKKIAIVNAKLPIVIKSTIPVGYTDNISKILKLINCFYSPEFLREGKAVFDNLNPSRIVVGAKNKAARDFIEMLSLVAHTRNIKTILTDNITAEITKLASNSYLAARVSFFNEIDSIALKLNLEAEKLIDGVCSDSRIGDIYNNPSFGYGGYCLPKDVKQFQSSLISFGVDAPLISSISQSNENRIQIIIDKILASGKTKIGIYRSQMKQGSDNSRESVNLKILDQLSYIPNISIKIYEPHIKLPDQIVNLSTANFLEFSNWAEIIIANRDSVQLNSVRSKVFTRDIYNEN